MARSEQLRMRDVRNVYRLIGEVGELAAAARPWRRHLLAGLCAQAGARVGWTTDVCDLLPGRRPRPLASVDAGWDDAAARDNWRRLTERFLPADEDVLTAPIATLLRRRRFVTVTRDQLVDDRTWYASAHANVHSRGCGLDGQVISLLALPARGVCTGFMVSRPWGARPFGRRERRLIRLAHLELIRLYERNAARPPDELTGLPPRLRQTLLLLTRGRAEKEIARELGLSPHTVHDYVKALHQRFGVASRGELLATVLSRPRAGLVLPFWLNDPAGCCGSVPPLAED